ncbi:MAG TPA: FecR domain-containing protein [Chitinophagaceae bacterium]
MTDEMHSLLGKFFTGQATEEENATIRQWVDASEQNRADFTLLQQLWNNAGGDEQLVFDTDRAWQSVQTKINVAKKPAKTIRLFVRSVAAAASVLLILGMYWIVSDLIKNRTVFADIAVKEVQLNDGSKVYLRKGTTLKYPRKFDDNRRAVTLTGEAFFEVEPDASKPFVITAAQTLVEVVGTSFSVNTKDREVELIVKTGLVNFGPANKPSDRLRVAAGEKALFADNKLRRELNTDENFNAWQTKQLIFSNTPLPEVAAVLSTYYNVKIYIRKEDLAQLSETQLTARFNDQPLSKVLNEISLITSYKIQHTGENNYEISLNKNE